MGANAERSAGSPRILVIGGANTDVIGVSDIPLVPADSNPGHARITPGGVARNVAANLAYMGSQVSLITVFGDDSYSRSLAKTCRDVGVDVSRSLTVSGAQGSLYIAVVDSSGELVSAVSDMRVLAALTPAALRVALDGIGPVDGVVIDTNPSLATLGVVFERFKGVRVFADAVSTAKAPRLLPFLGSIESLKASVAEATSLTGEEDPARAAGALVDRGLGCAWVTAGPVGVFWARPGESGFEEAPTPAETVNTTGAGDAFMAGVVYSSLKGWGIARSARFALGAASLTVAAEETVSPHIEAYTAAAIRDRENE